MEINESMARIQRMEGLYDRLKEVYETKPRAALKETETQAVVHTLSRYYTEGGWLHDYALDEKGEIPKTLKRGVLSEDGLYNLLNDVMDALDE